MALAFFSARFIQWVKPQGLEDLLYSILSPVLLCIICVGINNIGFEVETGPGLGTIGAGVLGGLLLIYNIVKYKIFDNIIMSLVHLSSIGQRPHSFYNQFPNGIQLGTNASVCLVGYSGQLDGEVDPDTGEVFSITINKDQNDTFVVQHADLSAAANLKGLAYGPQKVIVKPGNYTPLEFEVELQRALNASEWIGQYLGGWTVLYNPVAIVGPPAIPAFTYTIKCDYGRNTGVLNGGSWINYIGGTTGVGGGGAAATTLNPYQTPTEHIGSFIDTEPTFIGDCSQAIGTAGATQPNGITMEFTAIAGTTGLDAGYTLCMVARRNATKMKLVNENSNNLEMSSEAVPDPDNDFAYGAQGLQAYGYTPHGLTVRDDGQVGIIESITGNIIGNNKSPENWEITWTAVNLNLGVGGDKKLAMSPRWDAVNNYPVIEYLYWNAATWVSLGTREIDGPRALPGGKHITYHYDQHYYGGVVVNPLTAARTTSRPITIRKQIATAGANNNLEPITFAFEPYDDEVSNTEAVNVGGMFEMARDCNHLGQTCGFPQQTVFNTATMSTVGISSELSLGKLLTNGDYSSLLITCPSLPITGYIGGAIGTTSPLLAVGRVNGNSLQYGFSGETAENWIELRNTRPLTLYRLKIEVKTDTNNDYLGLEPNFAVWIKFKSNTDHLHLTSPDVMGVITN